MIPNVRRLLIALVTLSLLAVTLAAPALGAKGGNSAFLAACANGGSVNWITATGSPFKNDGTCVKYATQGGILVPVNQFSISYRAGSSPGLFGYTLTGAGLVPGTFFRLFLNYDGGSTNAGEGFVDSNGDFLVTGDDANECLEFGRPLLSVSVGAGGFTALATPLPFPDAFCTPPA